MPDWLPPILSTNGIWEEVLAGLYEVFEHDFKNAMCLFEGRQVWWDRRVTSGERYEEGFWHLISKGDHQTGERLFDPRRAERLSWCRPTLINSNDADVVMWDFREPNRRVHTYVWLRDWDYVVILEKRRQRLGEIAFLVTAYYVGGESTRKKLLNKYSLRER